MDEDRRLLAEHVAGNSQEAFTRLVERHIGMVHSAALRSVEDVHLADDVTQAVFLLLWRNAARLKANVVIAGWLFITTRNISADMVKTERRRKRYESKAAAPLVEDPQSQEPDWDQIRPLLNDAVSRLARGGRDAVVLRYFEGRSYAEISSAMGISEDAAKKRVSRAVEKLRKNLTRAGASITPAALGGVLASRGLGRAPVGGAGAASQPSIAGSTVRAIARRAQRHMLIHALAPSAAAIAAAMLLTTAVILDWNRHWPFAAIRTPPAPWVIRPGNGFRFEAMISVALARQILAAAHPVRQVQLVANTPPMYMDRPTLAKILHAAGDSDLFWLADAPGVLLPDPAAQPGEVALRDAWSTPHTVQVGGQTVSWKGSGLGTIKLVYQPGQPTRADISYTCILEQANESGGAAADCSVDLPSAVVLILSQGIAFGSTEAYELVGIQVGQEPPPALSQWLAVP